MFDKILPEGPSSCKHACMPDAASRTKRLTRSLPGAVSTHPRRAGCSSTSSVEQHLAARGQSGRAGQRAGQRAERVHVRFWPSWSRGRRPCVSPAGRQARHSQPLRAALPLLHPDPTRPRNAQGRPRTVPVPVCQSQSVRTHCLHREPSCAGSGWMLASTP